MSGFGLFGPVGCGLVAGHYREAATKNIRISAEFGNWHLVLVVDRFGGNGVAGNSPFSWALRVEGLLGKYVGTSECLNVLQ